MTFLSMSADSVYIKIPAVIYAAGISVLILLYPIMPVAVPAMPPERP